jgi:transcription-repair coupling factor (superfamily II helicase)
MRTHRVSAASDLRYVDTVTQSLDPLPPILPPEGVEAVKLGDAASRVARGEHGRLDIAGVRGSASALVARAVARAGRKVVLVAPDADAARRLADDVGSVGATTLVFATDETSPYAPVNPDRRAAMGRMSTLASLLEPAGDAARVLVVDAASLARKVVPRGVVRASTYRVVAEDALDRDRLIARLSETGYLRVPLVEDPGSFAVRGALLDIWAPGLPDPVRIELYGDLVVSIKPFDPLEQKTRKDVTLPYVALAPVREAILAREYVARARDRVSQLADAIDMPTLKARALIDDVISGRASFGADAYVPAFYERMESLFDYVGEDAVVMLDDPPAVTAAIREALSRADQDFADLNRDSAAPHFLASTFFDDEKELVGRLAAARVVPLHRLYSLVGAEQAEDNLDAYETTVTAPLTLAAQDHEDLGRAVKNARGTRATGATLAPLLRRIAHWHDHGLSVIIAARAETQADRLASLLDHLGVRCVRGVFDPDARPERGVVGLVTSKLSRGVVLAADGLVIVTEEEVFGARARVSLRDKSKDAAAAARSFAEDLRTLAVGDYVVHVDHGIGRYQGLVHKEVGGLTVDLLVIEYDAGDKLYLPVYRLNQLQKYSAGEGAPPKIDRLGGQTFARTKTRAKKAIREMADQLLRLYAERRGQTRTPLPALDDEYRAFEATFPFDETPDQGRAIDDVQHDLGEPRPMDRLVCGDVGFGKTEVAIRAAFRVAMAGKQVAVLCPTTVLAQQHFRTFEARLRDYPIRVVPLSRFQSEKQQRETLLSLKEGRVEIIVGTHRLLSKDVHFKDLGLLVVDEEQRFGVAHKERIKQLRAQVDVLTLTATPIPRTLQMAVGGIRDLSLIKTAPTARRAVRTIVTRYEPSILAEAVRRELARGGQTFYVYNRIEGIYERAQRLQDMVPEARIAVGHGQMSDALEKTMIDFVDGKYDVLVATVGIDLFCQMLDEAVHELRGEEIVHEVDPELSFDVVALLPEVYVLDVGVRLSLYKRLASAIDEAHVADIAEEMEDRFGPPPPEAKRLVQLMTLKTELRRMRVLGCEANARLVTLHLREDTPLDPKKISELIAQRKSPYRLSPDMRLVRRFDATRGAVDNVETVLADLAKCLKP